MTNIAETLSAGVGLVDFVYLDNAASGSHSTASHEALIGVIAPGENEGTGNPHAGHCLGVQLRTMLEEARTQVLDCMDPFQSIRGQDFEVIFNSGSTEGINHLIKGFAFHHFRREEGITNPTAVVLHCTVDHPAVVNSVAWLEKMGLAESRVFVIDSSGLYNLNELERALGSVNPDAPLFVSLTHVLPEVGSIQPISAAVGIVKQRFPNCLVHLDAAQSMGKIAVPFEVCDFVTIAGHKFYAIKGAGAVIAKRDALARIEPLVHGAGQESGHRAGTEAVQAILSMGASAKYCKETFAERNVFAAGFRSQFLKALQKAVGFHNVVVNTRFDVSSPYILNVSLVGLKDAPAFVKYLGELKGPGGTVVCCSAGTACHSRGAPLPSRTLSAMGLPDDVALGGLRFSFSADNSEIEIGSAAGAIAAAYRRLRS